MNWLAPAMFAGLAALAAPVLAHLLGRREPRRVEFAALRFLTDAEPHVDRRPRLRDIGLLALRVLAMTLLVLALARPVTLEDRELPVYGAPHDAVLLIDSSASMLFLGDEGFAAQTALERAQQIYEALPAGSRAAWLVSDPDGPSRSLSVPESQRLEGLEKFIREDLRPGSWPLADALEPAIALFDDPDRPRVVYAISDPTAGGLGSLPKGLGDDIRLVAVSTRDEQALVDQIGIEALQWSVAKEVDPRAIRVSASLRRNAINETAVNRSAGPNSTGDESQWRATDAVVAFEVDGQEVSRSTHTLAPGQSAPLEFTHSLVHDADTARVSLRLVEPADDAFDPDNLREAWVSSDSQIRITIVNGDPSDRRSHDEVFFLVTALNQGLTAAGSKLQANLRALSPDQLARELAEQGSAPLAQTDVLVLANVEHPAADLSRAIDTRVRAGMGLWITAGDRVGVKAYNERFDGLLPLRLRGASLAGTAPGRQKARFEGMSPAVLSHPIFAGRDHDLELASSKTERRFLLEPDPSRGADVALSFASGAPALITRRVGAGRVAFLATSLDRDWSDLAIRPGFVPLVEATLTWLAGDARAAALQQYEIDAVVQLAGEQSMRVEGPGGMARRVDPTESGLVFDHCDRPGLYLARSAESHQADSDTDDGSSSARVAAHRFSVQVDSEESLLETVPIASSTRAQQGDQRLLGQRPAWRQVLWMVLVLLLLEGGLRSWFPAPGRHRAERLAAHPEPNPDST